MSAADPLRPLRDVQPAASTLDAAQLRAVIGGMSVGLLVIDEHGLIIDANPAAEALLGLPRVEIIGRNTADARWQVVDAEGAVLPAERLPTAQVLAHGRPVHGVELGVALIGGGRRWLLVDCIPMESTGRPRGAVCTFVDAGRRRTLEKNLTQQGRRLRAVLEGTRTSSWQWNRQTGELQIDERWAAMLGLQLEALQPVSAATWISRVHPEDLPLPLFSLQRRFDGEAETFESEYRMRHADGGWRWMRDRGRVVSYDAAGQPVTVLGTHDDITERIEAEAAQTRNADLMRALFELSPLGLQLIDVEGRTTVTVNAALTRITGYDREDLLYGNAAERFPDTALARRQAWFESAMSEGRFGPEEVAFRHKDGHIIRLVFQGVTVHDSRHGDHVWISVADVTARHEMERQLRLAASTDPLTGLANRSALRQALQEQIELQCSGTGARPGLAVFFLDLDRFKFVNDTLGHNVGDELLRGVAQRLRETAARRAGAGGAPTWIAARPGGDEFVIVVPGADSDAAAQQDAQAVIQALSAPFALRQQEMHVSTSIGVALWRPGVTSADAMLRDADIAMYEAKHLGRGRCVLFDDTMRSRLTRAVVIENELRHAVARQQLQAVYQPIVDLETGEMHAVEALLRWNHPEMGAVSPAEFIPVAEESGHITVLGEWILRTACRQWAAWQRENPAAAPKTMSVNLSREQVAQGQRVLALVQEALADAQMPAAALQLEITEREVMKNPEQARELLHELSAMGVKLAMDDFGTGTSSLGCLRDYPFDTIKIDKSFVTNLCRDPQVLAVAHATVNVIENLGMVSVAEGIEDPAEVAALQAMGCHYGQGFLFARPQPGDALLQAMAGGAS